MTVVTPKFGMGASVLRLEDNAFITGKGRYTDDISNPKAHCMAMCCARRLPRARSSWGLLEAARKASPGVHLVLTGADLAHLKPLKSGVMQKQPDGTARTDTRHPDPVP